MKISIITVAYNSAATIRDTIESVLCQDYPNLEYLIVDGGSKDETISIVREYEGRLRYISERDKGIYDGMNKGIGMATGDVIGLLNSDDFYADAQVLSDVARLFEQQNTQTVYGDLDYVAADDTSKTTRTWKSGAFHHRQFLFGWMPPHPTFFVHRTLYEQFGVFRNEQFRISADYELMLRLLYKHRVTTAYLPRTIIKMRAGGASNAQWKFRIQANKEDRLAWRINELRPHFYTTFLKPLRKLKQFI
jgi:glycosyltransferase involved in cell wall biosynthesis